MSLVSVSPTHKLSSPSIRSSLHISHSFLMIASGRYWLFRAHLSHSSGPEFLVSFAGPGWGTFPGAMLERSTSRCTLVCPLLVVLVLVVLVPAVSVDLGRRGGVVAPFLLVGSLPLHVANRLRLVAAPIGGPESLTRSRSFLLTVSSPAPACLKEHPLFHTDGQEARNNCGCLLLYGAS